VDDWFVKNTRYFALEFGIYGYKPRRCVQTVARGWGDCKDKATVIVTLLKELGIDSTIVIVRSQMRGDFSSGLPSLAPFDHAIAYVPSQDLYLDGTAEFTGSTELPKMDLGALALQVNHGKSKLTRLPSPDPERNVARRMLSAVLSADGSAKLDVSYETRGAAAGEWRRRYHADATRRERVTSDLAREFPGFTLDAGNAGLDTGNLDDLEQPVAIRLHGGAPAFARREGNQLILHGTMSVRLTPTYASLFQRRQDVRILAFTTVDETVAVKLPPGTSVLSAPPAVHEQSNFGSYSVDIDQQPGQVTVRSRLAIRVSRVRPAEYAAWRKFCGDVDRLMSIPLTIGPGGN
jgi:cellulose synthase operon protein C